MSAQTEIFAGISIWLQSAIPASIGPSFFATVYYTGFTHLHDHPASLLLSMGGEQDSQEILSQPGLGISPLGLLQALRPLGSSEPGPPDLKCGAVIGRRVLGPDLLDLSPTGNSFPSGHVLTLTAAAIAIWPMKRLRIMVLGLLLLDCSDRPVP